MKLQSLKITKRQGFGLVETLIAVTILALVLLVSVTLGSMVLRSMTLRAQTVQATNLARLKLEEVRSVRDNTWLGGRGNVTNWDDWGGPIPSRINFGTGYVYTVKKDSSQLPYLSVGSSDGDPVLLSFGQNSTIQYNSKINVNLANIDKVDNGSGTKIDLNSGTTAGSPIKILQIKSEVTWNSYGTTNTVTLNTYLSDWLPKF